MLTLVLNKGENYHLAKTENGYEITYHCDGKFYLKKVTFEGVANTPVQIGYADEKLNLSSGEKLVRTEENLTVIKE